MGGRGEETNNKYNYHTEIPISYDRLSFQMQSKYRSIGSSNSSLKGVGQFRVRQFQSISLEGCGTQC